MTSYLDCLLPFTSEVAGTDVNDPLRIWPRNIKCVRENSSGESVCRNDYYSVGRALFINLFGK